uniref:Macaca fascicularis brain cDNA clone: QmoA-11161, similar to human stress-induced-phosphoprotein 1(Hsp70/Hsp90-organizing protein) (STIP1), mRNA, RefSeq: NM_006819.1 n=1 Tax=Macaca fascicularis TaxID=9541 RepID=I7GH80_MACFA|nr:unnamed protein product [Macaca fascicularis]
MPYSATLKPLSWIPTTTCCTATVLLPMPRKETTRRLTRMAAKLSS